MEQVQNLRFFGTVRIFGKLLHFPKGCWFQFWKASSLPETFLKVIPCAFQGAPNQTISDLFSRTTIFLWFAFYSFYGTNWLNVSKCIPVYATCAHNTLCADWVLGSRLRPRARVCCPVCWPAPEEWHLWGPSPASDGTVPRAPPPDGICLHCPLQKSAPEISE